MQIYVSVKNRASLEDWGRQLSTYASYDFLAPQNVANAEPPRQDELHLVEAWRERGMYVSPADITMFAAGVAYGTHPSRFTQELAEGRNYGAAARRVLSYDDGEQESSSDED